MANETITAVQFGKTVSLSEAEALICAVPENRFHLRGEPGIGKSAMLRRIAEKLGMDYAYIDVPNMDLGDIAMPVVDHQTRTTKYYPNSRFKFHMKKPIVIMLDEFSKGSKPVKDMLHPLLEVKDARLGDEPVPDGSVIFTTGNLSTDGVGDNLAAHTRARLTTVTVRKPNAKEWLNWAVPRGIEPEVCAWVSRYEHVLDSYLDGNTDNPYIFNPRKQQDAYVCPRTLELASNIVSHRADFSADALIAALTGVIGEAGARDMQAFVAYADQLPTKEAIKANPKTAPLPTQPGACAVTIFNLVRAAEKDNFEAFVEYVERMETEWQAVFAVNVARTPGKQSIAFSSKKFASWLAQNQDVL